MPDEWSGVWNEMVESDGPYLQELFYTHNKALRKCFKIIMQFLITKLWLIEIGFEARG